MIIKIFFIFVVGLIGLYIGFCEGRDYGEKLKEREIEGRLHTKNLDEEIDER